MKRILIFSLTYFPTRIGGAEIAIKEITDRLGKEDFSFDLITLKIDSRLPDVEKYGNVTLYRIGFAADMRELSGVVPFRIRLAKVLYPIEAYFAAQRLHRQRPYDGIWAMMAAYAGFAALFFKFAHPNVPYLLTLQEGDPTEHILRKARLVHPLFRRIFSKADALQAISTHLMSWGAKMGFKGEGRVIPNAVDTNHFAAVQSPQRLLSMKQRLGKREGEVFLVTTSRLVHKNAIDDVIRALALLPQHVSFLIYGTGPDDKKLRGLAKELGVTERTRFMGQIGHEEMPLALSACDIFVRPSRSEGMGNSFVEAFAAGLPVIATQEGGIADFLFDEKRNPDKKATGWAVDPDSPEQIAEAVKDILEHPAKAQLIAQAARELALSKYDWNLIVSDMRSLFDTVLAARKPMRLLIATPLYPPELGGPATYSKLLEEGLPSLGAEVKVVKFSSVRHLPKGIRHIAYLARLIKEGRSSDLLLVLDPVSTGLPAVLASKILRKPLVLKIVGDYAWEQGRQRFGITTTLDEFVKEKNVPFAVRTLRKIETWVARHARTVLVPSEYLKGIVASWGMPEDKIVVIPNAVTLFDGGEVPAVVQQLPHPRIVTVARLVPWKGIDRLIEAVAKMETKASLTIVGDGPEHERLQRLAQETLSSMCVFTGALPPEDVHAVLRSADIFVLNSTYEGLSHVLIEALMTGLPIIATDAGGNREVLAEGSGLLVPIGDQQALVSALSGLANTAEERKKLRSRALERSQAFTADAMTSRTHEVLSNV